MARRRDVLAGASLVLLAGFGLRGRKATAASASAEKFPVTYTDAQWRARLTPAQYDVLRDQGTEAPFSSPLDHETAAGIYDCAGCSQKLYSSATKFDSGTGWPSFYEPLPNAIAKSSDDSFLMERTEVHCARCGGHLGHVFADGPPPTGLRYCMNGVAMNFVPAGEKSA